MFERCCKTPRNIDFSLVHNPVPFTFGIDAEEVLKKLLLYVPNVDSVQSKQIPELDSALYEDFVFLYILDELGMKEESDVKFKKHNEDVDVDDWNFFRQTLCTNCQKIIICRYNNQTKTKNLLRCIRNSIAHGDYFIIDEYFIGFNTETKRNGDEHHKAVIKIKYKNFLAAIEKLTNSDRRYIGLVKEKLIKYAFEKMGYNIVKEQGEKYDLELEKDGREYLMDFVLLNKTPYIKKAHIERYIKKAYELNKNQRYVLTIDSSRITNEVKRYISDIGNCVLLDISSVKDALEGVDVLMDGYNTVMP